MFANRFAQLAHVVQTHRRGPRPTNEKYPASAGSLGDPFPAWRYAWALRANLPRSGRVNRLAAPLVVISRSIAA